MIKSGFIIVFSFLALSLSTLKACDVCGSGAGNIGIGLLTDYRSNFVRLTYFSSRFDTQSGHEYAVSDAFTRWDLSLRCALLSSGRLNLRLDLPYGVNVREIDGKTTTLSGLSDARIIANYAIVNARAKRVEEVSFYWEAGAGLSIPIGAFDEDISDRNLPYNFNLGRGSWGYIFQTNAVLNYGKMGMVFNHFFQWNRESRIEYLFGHQYNAQWVVFREISDQGSWGIIPNVGFSFEHVSKDRYANGKEVLETGGNGFFLNAAINFRSNRCLLGLSYSSPISSNYSNKEVVAKGRIAGHASYIF